MSNGSTDISLTWHATRHLKDVADPKRLILLLHGYQQNAELIFTMMADTAPADCVVLAPDAPFPVPQKRENGYHMGFTWYFFDPETKVYYLDMEQALRYLTALVDQMGYANLPTTVIGYSQGGYLAPFVGQRLKNVDRVIGVNARYKSETLPGGLPFRMDALHGALDNLVDPVNSQQCFEELIAAGNRGEFRLVPDCGHGISAAIRNALRDWLAKAPA